MREVISTQAVETPLCIAINGIAHAVMMVTPSHLESFAVGFAYSEGIIESVEQIRDLDIHEDQHLISTADVTLPVESIVVDLSLSPRQLQNYKKNQHFRRGLTGCGLCGSYALKDALPELTPLSPADLPPLDVLYDLHTSTQNVAGVHFSQLMSPNGTALARHEDIGRHNALDKVLGFALRERLNLHQHYAILSSRCSVELVQKGVRAGLSTLVHLSSPSNLAVKMAKHYRLNLVQVLRSGEIKIHVHTNSEGGES